jgi:hypothetical protein
MSHLWNVPAALGQLGWAVATGQYVLTDADRQAIADLNAAAAVRH